MAQGGIPLIAFGAIENFSTWNKVGTPVITGGQTDPFGGTAAYQINDDNGAAAEYIFFNELVLTANANGEAIMQVFLRAGTAAQTDLLIRDQDAPAGRHQVNVNWSGGTPTLSTQSGAGTLFTPINCGGGWWFIRFSATGIISGNRHQPHIFPASDTPSATGTVFAFGMSAVVFGMHLVDAVAWDAPREGSEWAVTPAGTEDAWIVDDDELLEGTVRWVPFLDEDNPQNKTGWDGRREHAMMNVGWRSLLNYAADLDATLDVRFAPSRANTAAFHNVFIKEPREGIDRRPQQESDATKRFDLLLRDKDGTPFEGY